MRFRSFFFFFFPSQSSSSQEANMEFTLIKKKKLNMRTKQYPDLLMAQVMRSNRVTE